jgi:hypothetical protein
MEPTETEQTNPFDVYAAAQNPQPEQAMPQFNEGGFVFGGTSLPGMPNPFLNYESKLTPEVRNILEGRGPQNEQYQQELAEYQRQVDDYNKGVLQYQDQYKQYEQDLVDYQSQLDAYNNEVNAYNDLAKGYTDQYQGAYNRWLSGAEAYNRQVEQIQQKQKVFDAYADVYNQKVIPLYTNKNLDPPDFNLWAKEVAEGKRFALEPDLYDKTKNKNQSWTDANKNIQLRLGRDPKKPGAGVNPFPGSLESIYANLPTAPEEFKYEDPNVAKPTFSKEAPTFSKEAPTFSREKPVAPTLTAPNYDAKKLEEVRLAREDAAKYGKQRELALNVAADPNAYNLAGFGMKNGGEVSAMERVRDFLQAMDVTPLDALYAAGRTGAGAAIGLMPSSLNEGEDELLAKYRAMAERERSTPQPPMARSNGSPPYGEDVDMQMFGSTGDRSMEEAKKGLGRSVDAIRRGVQYSPADLLGAPVDVINMMLDPVGLGSEKPFMGSEYLIDKGVQAGIYEKPTGEGEETLARFAAGMINPTLGPRAVGKMAEGIETLGKTPPKGAVTLADQTANTELKTNVLGRSDNKPFVGELESLLQGLGKEEVTPSEVRQLVTQYKEALGSKMERRKRRVLEERIDEIFENRDPNTPIALSQIYSDLERTSPKRLTQEILGPEHFAKTTVSNRINLSENIDNPYKNEKPLGVTTILFDTPKGLEDIGGLIYDIDKQAQGLQETYEFIGGDQQVNLLRQLQKQVQEFEQRMPSPQLSNLKTEVNDALNKMPDLQKLTGLITDATMGRPKLKELDAVAKSLRKDFPELFDDLRTPQLFEDPMRRNTYASIGGPEAARFALTVSRATHAKTLKGLLNFEKELIQQGKMNENLQGHIDRAKFKLSKNAPAGVDEFDNAALYSNNPAGFDEEIKQLRLAVLFDVLKSYQAGAGNEAFRTIRNAADKFTAEASKSIPFGQGKGDYIHEMNTKGRDAQQLGFTRFVEFEPTDTILRPYSSSMSSTSRVPVYDFPQSKKGAIFATELQSDMRRAVPKKDDDPFVATRPFETPFNLRNQEALRDLLIKNMVDVAVKRNRDLVLFPSSDSARPELYENIHKFVETTVKDLGPNFKAVEVMTVNGQGKRVVRSGIFITPEGEKEILEKGLKFAKGGMVDKPLYDRAA